jgi:hypothetical protein
MWQVMRSPALGIGMALACLAACSEDCTPPAAWLRPLRDGPGGDAVLGFVVLGDFPAQADVPAGEYRILGKLDGLVQQKRKKGSAIDELLGPSFAKVLVPDGSILTRSLTTPERIDLRATVHDPKDLVYLRNAVGVITWLMDHGGTAVVDIESRGVFDRDTWRQRMFADDAPRPRHHANIFVSAQEAAPGQDKRLWVLTHGMRKFGRPDISVRDVPAAEEAKAIELVERFIVMMAQGAQLPEGKAIRM